MFNLRILLLMSTVSSTVHWVCWSFPLDIAVGGVASCTTATYRGKCVALQDCSSLFKVFVNLQYLPRKYQDEIGEAQCGFNASAMELKRKVLVCCPNAEGETSKSSNDRMLAETVAIDNLHCGVVNTATNGQGERKDHYPWMALIEYVDVRDPTHHGFNCTGSLINNHYVLTAAHCVLDVYWRPTRILLGNWNSDIKIDCLYHTHKAKSCPLTNSHRIEIEDIIAHSKFPKESQHDIALIRLKQTIAYTPFVRPICLPFGYTMGFSNLAHHMAEYISWGQTIDSAVITNRKMKIPLRIWETEKCRLRYRPMERNINLQHEICAGGEQDVDTCKGDSGGALTYAHNNGFINVHYMVGVMVGGTQPCGLQGWPNISVSVKSHLEWILNFMVKR